MRHETAFTMDTSSIKFGPGVTREIGEDMKDLGCSRLMVCTDPVLRDLEPVQVTLEALEADDESLLARKEIIRRYNKMLSVRKNITRHSELSKIIEMANQGI